MSAVTRPRGPLPRRVYWVRRLLVLGVAVALVVGIAWLLGGSGDGQGESATTVASSPSATPAASPSAEQRRPEKQRQRERAEPKKPRLPQPEGPCADSDVVVTPSITDAHVNQPIKVVLWLTTQESEACTWEVDPESVFLTIAGEDGTLWSSQQCPHVIPTEAVVPRREKADKVTLWWDGRESDARCTRFTPYVWFGSYTATAVARGSVDPVEVDFVLGESVRPTVTVTPTPTPKPERD
jgi:hypothetical protein